jgi:hypothetical protein
VRADPSLHGAEDWGLADAGVGCGVSQDRLSSSLAGRGSGRLRGCWPMAYDRHGLSKQISFDMRIISATSDVLMIIESPDKLCRSRFPYLTRVHHCRAVIAELRHS